MKKYCFIFVTLFCFCLSACSTLHGTAHATKERFPKQTEEQLFANGKQAMKKHNYQEATEYLETLNTRYPFSQFTERSLSNLIYAYYKRENFPFALATANQYIRLYPRGQYVDYAYYMRGHIQMEQNKGVFERYLPFDESKRDLTDLRHAYLDFNQLVHYLPNSTYTPAAKHEMLLIRNRLALHELQVGEFYYKREAYVAAANRASEIINHYQQTPVVPEALKLLAKSYQQLHLDKEAENTLRVLHLNFPASTKMPTSKKTG